MDLIREAKVVLENNGYSVEISSQENILYFEDISVLGFLSVYQDVHSIVAGWEKDQDEFLKQHASCIRNAQAKAWNVYSIFLTREDSPPQKKTELVRIEEDFRSTRKIARCNLKTRQDLTRCLLSLLPIQHSITMMPEDLILRLRSRLSLSSALTDMLLGDATSDDILRGLSEEDGDI